MAMRVPSAASPPTTDPARTADSKAVKREFEWNSETSAALEAAFASEPAKLTRMQERLAETRANEAKLRALRARKAALLQRNRTFRQKAGLPPAQEEREAEAPLAVPPPTTESCPTPVPTPSPHPGSLASMTDEFDESTINTRSAAVPSDWGQRVSLYQYSGPALKGVVSSVFEDGLLYRIITEHGDWAFYNDSRYYEMHVHYVFHEGSNLTAGSRCSLSKTASGKWEATMTLAPEETLVLVSGKIVDFENKSQAVLLSRRSCSASSVAAGNLCATQKAELLAIEKALSTTSATATGAQAKMRGTAASHGGDGEPEADAEQEDEAAARVSLAQRLPFVDPTFFPDAAALCASGDDFFLPPLRWQRPRDYVPPAAAAEVRLFRDDRMHPWHLVQGTLLPDSAFISAVRALAETPALVRRLFCHPSGDAAVALAEHALGMYRVQLCCGGLWRTVLIDDYVPSKAHCPEFAHVSSDLRRIWLPLLEKAYAKACGSFSAILNAPLEAVAQDICGVPGMSLDNVWPSVGAQGAAPSSASAGSPASLETFIDSFYRHARGKILLKPFSLATARTTHMRERLTGSYHSLGLTPGLAVVILGVEKYDGATLVRLRQTLTPSKSSRSARAGAQRTDADDEPDWLQVWLDEKKPWAPVLADVLAEHNEAHTLYMDVQDIPQYFQGGCAFYTASRLGEVRLAGNSLFVKGTPSHCLAIEVSAPTTLMVTLTQVKQLDHMRGLSLGWRSPNARKSSGDECVSSSSLGSLSAFGSLDAIGIQVLATTRTLELAQCTRGNPDIFARAAPDDEVTYAFTTSVSVGVQLLPEMSPYFVVPRIQSSTATTPYTVALFLDKPNDGSVSVSAVSAAPFAKVLSTTKVPSGIAQPTVADVLLPVRVQYRWSGLDTLKTTEMKTLAWPET